MLLAEDNPGDVFLVSDALAYHELNAELIVQRDGEQMLRTIERIDAGEMPCPDVVLLDLNLPRRNGTEVLARIRESPSCGQVPVIVVTSSNARRDRETMVRLGASEYFHKPSDYDGFMSLGEVVRRVVGTLGGPQ